MGRAREAAEMSLRSVIAPLLLSLASGAPYSPNGAVEAPQPARLNTGSVECRTEYTTVWDTQYQEKETQQCVTNYEKVCQTVTERLCKATTRQECQTVYEKSCNTVYKSVCVDQYKTEYEPYTETESSTEYKEDCQYQWEGHGNNKVWAPIPGTCKQNPLRLLQGREQDQGEAGGVPRVSGRAGAGVPGRPPSALHQQAQEGPSEDQQDCPQEGL